MECLLDAGSGHYPEESKETPSREICGFMSGPRPIMNTPNTKTVLYQGGIIIMVRVSGSFIIRGWIFVSWNSSWG